MRRQADVTGTPAYSTSTRQVESARIAAFRHAALSKVGGSGKGRSRKGERPAFSFSSAQDGADKYEGDSRGQAERYTAIKRRDEPARKESALLDGIFELDFEQARRALLAQPDWTASLSTSNARKRRRLSHDARPEASCYPTIHSQAPSPLPVNASPALTALSEPSVQYSISNRANPAASTSTTIPPSTPPVSGWGSSLEESHSEASATSESHISFPPPSISPFPALPFTSPQHPPSSQQHSDPISLFSYQQAEKLEKRPTVPPSPLRRF